MTNDALQTIELAHLGDVTGGLGTWETVGRLGGAAAGHALGRMVPKRYGGGTMMAAAFGTAGSEAGAWAGRWADYYLSNVEPPQKGNAS